MATVRVRVGQLAAEAAQPVYRQRVEEGGDGARREQRLLVGLVQAAAQLGEQLVGRHARGAREAETARHLVRVRVGARARARVRVRVTVRVRIRVRVRGGDHADE